MSDAATSYAVRGYERIADWIRFSVWDKASGLYKHEDTIILIPLRLFTVSLFPHPSFHSMRAPVAGTPPFLDGRAAPLLVHSVLIPSSRRAVLVASCSLRPCLRRVPAPRGAPRAPAALLAIHSQAREPNDQSRARASDRASRGRTIGGAESQGASPLILRPRLTAPHLNTSEAMRRKR